MRKQLNSMQDPLAQPPTSDPSAQARAELIENLAVLVVRQHRHCRRQPPAPAADLVSPSTSPAPSTS
jgi:hypothetical protein